MSEPHPSAKSIFLSAIEIDSEDGRAVFVRQQCADDEAKRREVERLLSNQPTGSFLESPPQDLLAPTVDQAAALKTADTVNGTRIGPYKIREQIGEGGMGSVYVAEQQKPLRRKVALKLIKPGMDSKAVLGRFEAERNALALMNHPNIAKVLDAGTTEAGHPFFVMELVNGIPITQYCDDQKLPIRERLLLFVDVCSAIQHAHQKGIIHRDIKPSNVLVTELDGKPIAKVIDFGVAKALNQSLTEHSVYTAFQTVIGTPLYMSPEQASFSAVDVDTRSDVYSLGVLLYELLTGTTPFTSDDLKQAAQEEVFKFIREQEPPRPSNRISSLGQTATKISQLRRTQPEQLGRSVKGDLDWIVMKALSKERGRRYDSATRFAEDVTRYLDEGLVEARPPSYGYQLLKTYRRNRLIISSMAVVLFSLSGALVSVIQSQRQLQSVVDSLWETLADKALNAAFGGNTSTFEEAITKLELSDAPRALPATLRGVFALCTDDPREAVQELESVVKENSDSRIAHSALLWAYHFAGMPGKHEKHKMVLARLEPSETQDLAAGEDFAQFFECMASYINGSPELIQGNYLNVSTLLETHRDWGAAYALRARLGGELAKRAQSMTGFDAALEDLAKAKDRLGNSPLVLDVGLWIAVNAMQLGEAQSIDVKELEGLASNYADQIITTGHLNQAMEWAACYQYLYEDVQEGSRLEALLVAEQPHGTFMYASDTLAYKVSPEELAKWIASDNPETLICAAISLAIAPESTRDEKAIRAIEKRLAALDSPSFLSIALEIPCLLGDASMAKRMQNAARTKSEFKKDWIWFSYIVDYHSGTIDRAQLLHHAGPLTHDQCTAWWTIGMKALLDKDPDLAVEAFGNAVATRMVGHVGYHHAKLYLGKLKDGELLSQ